MTKYPFIFAFLLNIVCFTIGWQLHRTTIPQSNLKASHQHQHTRSSLSNRAQIEVNRRPFQLYAQENGHNDDSNKKSLFTKFSSNIKGFIFASMITLFTVSSVWAKRDSRSSLGSSTEKRQRLQQPTYASKSKSSLSASKSPSSTKEKLIDTRKKVELNVEIEDGSKNSFFNKDILNKVGVGMVGLTIIGAIVRGDNNKKTKQPVPKQKPTVDPSILEARKMPETRSLNEIRSQLKDRLKPSSSWSLNTDPRKLPDMDLLFEDEDAIDLVTPSTEVSKSKRMTRNIMDDDSFDSKLTIISDEAPTKVSSPTLSPPPAPTPQKKGFFDGIFMKSGSSRPTDLNDALRSAGDLSYPFRYSIFECLVNYVPPSYVDAWSEVYSSNEFIEDVALKRIDKMKSQSSLSPQEAADAFADVTNAMLVTLVDTAVNIMDNNKNDNANIDSIDVIADFIGGAGSLFAKSLSQVSIEPVQYSGKVKKGKLESLYYIYAKACMSMSSMLATAGLQSPVEGAVDSNAGPSAEEKLERLGRLQQVLGIKDSKHDNIMQRVMRESMMDMVQGGGGELGSMFEALKGGGAGAGDFADIMKNMSSGMMDGSLPPDLAKELENMSPTEAMQLSKSALNEVQASLENGSITKNHVAELEKVMGFNIKELVKSFDSGQLDKRELAELGPDYVDMMKIFRELAKL